MKPIKLGILGAGRIAQSAHLPSLAKLDEFNVVGIHDPSRILLEGVSAKYQIKPFIEAMELIENSGAEAILIATPDRFHAELATLCLTAGKHVFVEKPIALSVEQAEPLVRLAEQTKRVLQVGAMKRHDAGVEYAKAAIEEKIGRVLSASIWYRVMSELRSPTEATYFPAMVVDTDVRIKENEIKSDREKYLLNTHGAHVFDGIRYLLGEVNELSARMTSLASDYSWHGMLKLQQGGLANFEITSNVHSEWSEGAEIYGERGHVSLRTHFPVSLRASDVQVFIEGTGESTHPVFGDGSAYKRQLQAFARSISTGIPANPGPTDGLKALALISGVERSIAARGGWITL